MQQASFLTNQITNYSLIKLTIHYQIPVLPDKDTFLSSNLIVTYITILPIYSCVPFIENRFFSERYFFLIIFENQYGQFFESFPMNFNVYENEKLSIKSVSINLSTFTFQKNFISSFLFRLFLSIQNSQLICSIWVNPQNIVYILFSIFIIVIQNNVNLK